MAETPTQSQVEIPNEVHTAQGVACDRAAILLVLTALVVGGYDYYKDQRDIDRVAVAFKAEKDPITGERMVPGLAERLRKPIPGKRRNEPKIKKNLCGRSLYLRPITIEKLEEVKSCAEVKYQKMKSQTIWNYSWNKERERLHDDRLWRCPLVSRSGDGEDKQWKILKESLNPNRITLEQAVDKLVKKGHLDNPVKFDPKDPRNKEEVRLKNDQIFQAAPHTKSSHPDGYTVDLDEDNWEKVDDCMHKAGFCNPEEGDKGHYVLGGGEFKKEKCGSIKIK